MLTVIEVQHSQTVMLNKVQKKPTLEAGVVWTLQRSEEMERLHLTQRCETDRPDIVSLWYNAYTTAAMESAAVINLNTANH